MGYIGKKPAQVDVSLSAGSITAVEMAANSVLASEIAENAIGSSELANNAVTATHIPDNTITATHIPDGLIAATHLAADLITGAKIADDAIDSEHYTDGSIDTAHIADDAVTAAKLPDDVIDSEHYADGSIDTAHIADLNITTAKIANNAITAAKLPDNVITATHIPNLGIATSHIADNAITAAKIPDDSITVTQLAANSIDSDQYVDGSIDLVHMSANSIDSDQYVDGSIDAAHLAPAQTNITSLGTLTGLTVQGNITQTSGDYLYSAGTNFNIKNTSAEQNITFDTTPSGGSATERMRIKHDGKVGIGTASPEAGLHVVGGIHMPNASAISFDQAAGNLRNAILLDSGDDMIIGDTNFDDIYFSTGQLTKTVVIKQTTGNVGIGETVPLGKLHVKTADSGASVDASADELVIEGSANTGMTILSGASSSGSIYFGDSGTNWDGYIAYSQNDRKMTFGTAAGAGSVNINALGNVGIGVTPDTFSSGYTALQINGYAYNIAHSGGDHYITNNAYFNSGWKYGQTSTAQKLELASGRIWLATAASGSADAAITWNTGLNVDSSGRVGIGTTAPSDYHSLADDLVIAGSGDTGITIVSGTSSDGRIFFADGTSGSAESEGMIFYNHADNSLTLAASDTPQMNISANVIAIKDAARLSLRTTDANTYISAPSASNMTFMTGDIERMRIDSRGSVGIGVTPSTGWVNSTDFSALQLGTGAALWGRGSGDQERLGLTANLYHDGSNFKHLATGRVTTYEQNDGKHIFKYHASQSAGTSVTPKTAMTIDTSGNVGIGTSSPGANGSESPILDISQSTTGSKAAAYMRVTASTNAAYHGESFYTGHYRDTGNGEYSTVGMIGMEAVRVGANNVSGDLNFYTKGAGGANTAAPTQKMVIKADGKVGIGATNPAELLHVYRTTGDATKIKLQNAGTASTDDVAITFGNHQYDWSIGTNQSAGGHFQIARHETLGNYVYFTVLGNSGNVGIGGDTAPITNLTVGGNSSTRVGFHIYNSNTTSSSFAQLNLGHEQGGFTGGYVLHDYSGDMKLWNRDSGGLQFGTANTERMRITSTGVVRLTKNISSTQQATVLEVKSVNAQDQTAAQTADIDFFLIDSNTNTGVPQCRIGATGDDTGDQNHEAGGTLSFYVTTQSYASPVLTKRGEFIAEAGGDFYTNDGSVSSLSDVRVKTNITTLTDGLNIVTQLRPVTYEYNNTTPGSMDSLGEKDGITRYGLVADEVKTVAPHYVHEGAGHVNGELVDDFKSLSLQRMIPMLIKSIQELKTENDALKARVVTLEG